jgi:hypothetical protein
MRTLVVPIVLWLALAGPAGACSCVVPDGSRADHVRRGYEQAQFVFSAYVISVYHTDEPTFPQRKAKLRVLQVWKGNLTPSTWLEVESDSESGLGCGLAVAQDTAILAYTSGGSRPQALVSCSMTGPLHNATQDIPLLNKLAGRSK